MAAAGIQDLQENVDMKEKLMLRRSNADRVQMLIPRTLFALLFITLAPFSQTEAAFTSSITPDGTLGTSVAKSGSTYNINGGTRPGNGPNLFHSFGQFSVGTGDTASFNGPVGILNILSRVTGGSQSQIDGTIKSTIQGANLYLMNPAGVLFGPNASLNLTGSFHVTTADYLRLTDNVRFNAVPDAAKDALLTTAPVAAFGFLSANPAPITVQESILAVPTGQMLSLIGGDITITGGPLGYQSAPGGQITLASLASPGEAIPNVPGAPPALDVSSFARLGAISITENGAISTGSSNGGGTVLIRSDHLTMEDSIIASDTVGNLNGASIGIDIRVVSDAVLTNSFLSSQSFARGRAGDILVSAGSVSLTNGAAITNNINGDASGSSITLTALALTIAGHDTNDNPSGVFSVNLGAGGGTGRIELNVRDKLILKDGGTISVASFGVGGSIGGSLNTEELVIESGASITTSSLGFGTGGSLALNAIDATISGKGSGIFSEAAGSGRGGDIQFNALHLNLIDGGQISASNNTGYSGNAGSVTLNTGSLVIAGHDQSGNPSGVFSQSFGAGRGGTIIVQAGNLQLGGGGQVSATTAGLGNGGDVMISASDATLSGSGSGISTVAFGRGNGGNIVIGTRSLGLSNGATIDSSSLEVGRGGDIMITAGGVQFSSGATITAQSSGAGKAGNINITATDQFVMRDSMVTTQARESDSGNITIQVGNIVDLVRSNITTSVGTGNGNGGNLTIDSHALVLNQSQIIVNTFGGNGGNISIVVDLFLADPSSILSASSSLGIEGPILVSYPLANLSAAPQLLKIAPLTSACAARAQGGSFSSFTVAGRDGVPAEPGGLLPSPLTPMAPPAITGQSGREQSPEPFPTPLLRLAFALPSCPE